MTGGYHPTDEYAQACAPVTNYERLTSNFEAAVAAGPADVELICSVAIARVQMLERQLAVQDRKVAERLFEPTGNVSNVRSIKSARSRLVPGASA